MVEHALRIVRLDLERQRDIGKGLSQASGLRPDHAQKMTGGEITWVIGQHLQIQALGLRPSPVALQRDSLLVQGFSIHVSHIRPAWYPFANGQKQWAKKQ